MGPRFGSKLRQGELPPMPSLSLAQHFPHAAKEEKKTISYAAPIATRPPKHQAEAYDQER